MRRTINVAPVPLVSLHLALRGGSAVPVRLVARCLRGAYAKWGQVRASYGPDMLSGEVGRHSYVCTGQGRNRISPTRVDTEHNGEALRDDEQSPEARATVIDITISPLP